MSRLVEIEQDTQEFDFDDIVSFNHQGSRLEGSIVRVYNTRTVYHVLVDGKRYSVEVGVDDISSLAAQRRNSPKIETYKVYRDCMRLYEIEW